MSYLNEIGQVVWTALVGMKVTIGHLFVPSVTLQYPDVKWTTPERWRGRLHNNIDDCIGCQACSRVCPVSCITIETEKRGKDEEAVFTSEETGTRPKKLRVTGYDIDLSLCCFCGFCTEQCPTNCLRMIPDYEFSVYDKKELVYSFAVEKSIPVEKSVPKEEEPESV